MTITMNIEDLYARQDELQRIAAALGHAPPGPKTLRLAILDELGELNHELKRLWAWWKAMGDPDPVRVVDEASDVLHFVLIRDLMRGRGGRTGSVLTGHVPMTPVDALLALSAWQMGTGEDEEMAGAPATFRALCDVIAAVGATPEDLWRAYFAKTDENLRRWRAQRAGAAAS